MTSFPSIAGGLYNSLVLSPDGSTLYVGGNGANITAIATATNTITLSGRLAGGVAGNYIDGLGLSSSGAKLLGAVYTNSTTGTIITAPTSTLSISSVGTITTAAPANGNDPNLAFMLGSAQANAYVGSGSKLYTVNVGTNAITYLGVFDEPSSASGNGTVCRVGGSCYLNGSMVGSNGAGETVNSNAYSYSVAGGATETLTFTTLSGFSAPAYASVALNADGYTNDAAVISADGTKLALDNVNFGGGSGGVTIASGTTDVTTNIIIPGFSPATQLTPLGMAWVPNCC